jgi:aspartyl-tRNA(Asn)/glutamyl-tRNA(Gln) amidotransferase subunit C
MNDGSECGNFADSVRWSRLMSLTPDQVRNIARLARLAVDEGELDSHVRDLSSILDLVDRMNAVDATGVPPMAHPQHLVQRLRPDVVTEENDRERLQRSAPAVEGGFYLVPRVVE